MYDLIPLNCNVDTLPWVVWIHVVQVDRVVDLAFVAVVATYCHHTWIVALSAAVVSYYSAHFSPV